MSGVSFVVPVYNKAPHLEGVLRQIARQHGEFRRQYVFVDDGSTDGSLALLRDLTRGWPDTVIEVQTNRGSAAATNRGVALATQPYVKFVDADDLLTDDATERLLHALDGSDACLAFGRAAVFDPAGTDLAQAAGSGAVSRLADPLRAAMQNSLFNPTQCLVRTEAFRTAGGCDERVVFSQEYSMTLRLARRWPFMALDATLAYLPQAETGRLSANEGRQLQRVTRAVALFLRDHPDTGWWLKQLACRRAAYRAWKYVHRRPHRPAWPLHPLFWRQVRPYLPFLSGQAEFVERCAAVYDAAAPMRAGPATGVLRGSDAGI
ncbi:MAG: glycosyltransferase family 2 protein [Alphaproteobacteria bacterium]